MRKKEKEKKVFTAERCKDLEGLDEKREEAQECSCRYKQRMIEAYGRTIKEIFYRRLTRVKNSRPCQARFGRTI